MFNELKEVFYKVIALSEERNRIYMENAKDELITLNLFDIDNENEEYVKIDNQLDAYMIEQSFETIKVIQTVMYIGRDYIPTDEETGEKIKENPQDIYKSYRSAFDARGWNEKEIEASQMTDKLPLGEYLIRGLEVLSF